MRYFLFLIALLTSLLATPDDRTIIMEIGNEKGYPPYRYKENGQPKGIMYEVMEQIATKEKLTIKTKNFVKRRHDMALLKGLLDVVPTSRAWVSNPEEYAFTENVVPATDVIMTLKEKPLAYHNPKDLFGKLGIGILGYHYPKLSPHFKSGEIFRHDTTNEHQMMLMLDGERADFGIINELVAKWLIKQNSWKGKYLLSQNHVGQTHMGFMFSKRWKKWIPLFDQHIQKMRNSGALQNIIDRYTKAD